MCCGSALSPAACPACCSQYCITMATLAEPQPSFCCFTKGTSSQTPGGSAASSTLQRHKHATSALGERRSILSADCHDDQDQRRNTQDNDEQVPIGQSAGCEIGL